MKIDEDSRPGSGDASEYPLLRLDSNGTLFESWRQRLDQPSSLKTQRNPSFATASGKWRRREKGLPDFRSILEFLNPSILSLGDPWDDPLPHEYDSFDSELTMPTMDDRLKRAHQQLSYLTTPIRGKSLKNIYLICYIYDGAHEANEWDQNISHEKFCLSGGDIYDDPSLLKFYQNNDITLWGNYIKDEGEEDLHWVLQSKFKDDMENFIMEKKHHLNGLRERLDQQNTIMHEKFSHVFTTLGRKTSFNDPAMAITT
nr:hypothetical protein [Tanacetum cinerariifolium]